MSEGVIIAAFVILVISLTVNVFAGFAMWDAKHTLKAQNDVIIKLTDALNQTSEALQNSTKLLNKVAEVPE